MHVPQSLTLLLVLVYFSGAGCASPPIVNVHTTADLHHHFAPPGEASVNVRLWRDAEHADGDNDDDDSASVSESGRIIPRDLLTLDERNFLAGVTAGLMRAGFDVVETDQSPTYALLATVDTATGVYDSYRRVPVMESTTGFYHTRGGLRSYTATTTSDAIVPEKRSYVHRIVTLSAVPAGELQDEESLAPDLPAVVWRGRVVSDADVIDADLAHHVATMLESWGATAQREVKYRPAE